MPGPPGLLEGEGTGLLVGLEGLGYPVGSTSVVTVTNTVLITVTTGGEGTKGIGLEGEGVG